MHKRKRHLLRPNHRRTYCGRTADDTALDTRVFAMATCKTCRKGFRAAQKAAHFGRTHAETC